MSDGMLELGWNAGNGNGVEWNAGMMERGFALHGMEWLDNVPYELAV